MPTLVLAGSDDFQYPPRHQHELAAAIPGAHLELVDRAGHNAPHERPAEVNGVVRRFLAQRSGTGGRVEPGRRWKEEDESVER